MRLIPTVPSIQRLKKGQHAEGAKSDCDEHHEERVGGWTRREYMDVRGTENAYDSGRWVGKSIRTASEEHIMSRESKRAWRSVTFVLFVLGGLFLDPDELVPFFRPFLVQERFWYPCEEICWIHSLLRAR